MFNTTIQTLEQLKIVLGNLSNSNYTCPCGVLSESSIGQHTRHVIELFKCLLKGYDTGFVNYDNRLRDKEIENNLAHAIAQIEEIQKTLDKQDKPMVLEQLFDTTVMQVQTTYMREVIYNLEHTIHHKALIKIGIKTLSDIEIPVTFGVAPSTVEYNKQCVQ